MQTKTYTFDELKNEISSVAYVLVVLYKIELYINQRGHKKNDDFVLNLNKTQNLFRNFNDDKAFFIINGFVEPCGYGIRINRTLFYLAWEKYYYEKIKPLVYRGGVQ